jgi:hypothetical protein
MKAVAAAATEFLMTDPGLDEAQATAWVSRKLHEAGYSKDDGKPIMSNKWRIGATILPPLCKAILSVNGLRWSISNLGSRRIKGRDRDGRPMDPVPQRKRLIEELLAEFAPLLVSIQNPIKPPV